MITGILALILAGGAGGFAMSGADWLAARHYGMATLNLGFTLTLGTMSLATLWEALP